MKKSVTTIISALICGAVLWLASSCQKDNILVPPDSQTILFECAYVNYAWGYSHHGFFIDHQGRVLVYSQFELHGHPEHVDWNFPDNQGNISEQDLMENMQKATISDIVIDSGTLKKYAKKIYSVTDDNYRTQSVKGADMGTWCYACYRYDENTGTYKVISLLQKMENVDWVSKNNNKYAKQISGWLESIHEDVTMQK